MNRGDKDASSLLIYLHKDIKKQVKIHCIQTEQKIDDFVENVLAEYMQEINQQGVSNAT